MSDAIIPVVIALIVAISLLKRHNIFSEFVDGAKEGLKTVFKITPSMIFMVTLVSMFKSSGALNIITHLIRPICSIVDIPAEIIPLGIMRPISSSGAMAIFKDILTNHGADSFIGRVASVMQGSAETTFYTIMLYYGVTKVKNTRHTLTASLSADITAFIMSVITVKLILG